MALASRRRCWQVNGTGSLRPRPPLHRRSATARAPSTQHPRPGKATVRGSSPWRRTPWPRGRPPVSSPPVTDLDEHGRPEPPLAGDEAATLQSFLDYHRATLAWKTAGLDAAGLGGHARPLVDDPRRGSSSTWPTSRTRGAPVAARARPAAPWDTVDWKANRDWDLHSARRTSPSSFGRSGRTPWPAPWSTRRWPTAAGGGWPGAPGPTVGRPA
jgi:hypothetical protein